MNIDMEILAATCSFYKLRVEELDKNRIRVYSGDTNLLIIDPNDERIILGDWFLNICYDAGFYSQKYSMINTGRGLVEIKKQETFTKERACNYINYVCKQKFADYKEDDDRSHVLKMVESKKVFDEDAMGYIKHLMKGCSSFLEFRKYVLKNDIDCTLAKYGRN